MKRPSSLVSSFVLLTFICTTIIIPTQSFAANNPLTGLPLPGSMVNLSTNYVPMLIKGLKIHPDNPLVFDFIVDTGNTGIKNDSNSLRNESKQLIKYFLSTLAVTEKDLWVNLSPYEKNRIIPQELGQTELGAEMLAQDYLLKQITASLIYPEGEIGKKFWDKVYAQAQAQFGNVNIPVNTFNKVWVMPDQAGVFVRNNTAYVVKAHLKVMLEEDYLATQKNGGQPGDMALAVSPSRLPSKGALNMKATQGANVAQSVIRQIVLPELEHEVNEGKNFANLRQVFYSLILASWYKKNLKDAFLNQVYSDKAKIGGVDLADKQTKEKIYQQYLAAYKKGVFNYIKDTDLPNGKSANMPKKFFSGGLAWVHTVGVDPEIVANVDPTQLRPTGTNFAMTTAVADAAMSSTSDEVSLTNKLAVVSALKKGDQVRVAYHHRDSQMGLIEAQGIYEGEARARHTIKININGKEEIEEFDLNPVGTLPMHRIVSIEKAWDAGKFVQALKAKAKNFEGINAIEMTVLDFNGQERVILKDRDGQGIAKFWNWITIQTTENAGVSIKFLDYWGAERSYFMSRDPEGREFFAIEPKMTVDAAMTAADIAANIHSLEAKYEAAERLKAEEQDTVYTDIRMNIERLLQEEAILLVENKNLKDQLTALWIKVGTEQEMKGRVDAIKFLVAQEGINAERMKAANIVFKDGQPTINDLPVAKWDPYSAEIWAPYLNGHLKDLILATPLNLDTNHRIVEPASGKIGRFSLSALKALKDLEGKTDHLDRLNALVKLENDVKKNPDLGLAKAEELGWGEIKSEDDFRLFMKEFTEAMRFMKWVENWEAKRDKVSLQERARYLSVKGKLGINLVDDVFIVRVLSRNIPLVILEQVANGQMKKGSDYRATGQGLTDDGFARMVSLAGGSASRWKDSLATLIKKHIVNALHTPEGYIRQLAAYWLGNHEDGGETGVSLFLNNLQRRLARGVKSSAAFLVSPFTWDQIQSAKVQYFKGRANKPAVDLILQNPGSAQKIEGTTITDNDLPGKVLGHGNIRGWVPSIIQALKQGAVIDIWRSGDSPFMQLDLPQTQEIIGRMAEDGLMHVALGNFRNIGQKGGGLVNQDGIPNVIDTLIPNKPKMVKDSVTGQEIEFVADRDITVFSAFTNFINNAGLLYAVSRPEDNLLTWQDVLDITRGDKQKLAQLQAKLDSLTMEQIARFSRNLIDLMPSEFVKKDETIDGKKTEFVQWEQISGMMHGALPQAIKARMASEDISDERPLNLAYVDISVAEFNALHDEGAAAGEYVPGFVEVKGAGDLYGQLDSVERIYRLLVGKGVFDAPFITGQDILKLPVGTPVNYWAQWPDGRIRASDPLEGIITGIDELNEVVRIGHQLRAGISYSIKSDTGYPQVLKVQVRTGNSNKAMTGQEFKDYLTKTENAYRQTFNVTITKNGKSGVVLENIYLLSHTDRSITFRYSDARGRSEEMTTSFDVIELVTRGNEVVRGLVTASSMMDIPLGMVRFVYQEKGNFDVRVSGELTGELVDNQPDHVLIRRGGQVTRYSKNNNTDGSKIVMMGRFEWTPTDQAMMTATEIKDKLKNLMPGTRVFIIWNEGDAMHEGTFAYQSHTESIVVLKDSEGNRKEFGYVGQQGPGPTKLITNVQVLADQAMATEGGVGEHKFLPILIPGQRVKIYLVGVLDDRPIHGTVVSKNMETGEFVLRAGGQEQTYRMWESAKGTEPIVYSAFVDENFSKLKNIALSAKDLGVEIKIGTAGWRTKIGPFNVETVGRFAQGAARALSKSTNKKVLITYDARKGGREYALHFAEVMNANGYDVTMADEFTTTPATIAQTANTYAIAFQITASHNPADDQGIKILESGVVAKDSISKQIERAAMAINSYQYRVATRDEIRPLAITQEALKRYQDGFSGLAKQLADYRSRNPEVSIVVDAMYGSAGSLAVPILNEMDIPVVRPEPMSMELYPKGKVFNEGGNMVSYRPEPKEIFLSPKDFEDFKKNAKEGSLYMAIDGDADRLAIWVKTGPGENDYLELAPNDLGILYGWYMIKNGLTEGKKLIAKTQPTTAGMAKLVQWANANYGGGYRLFVTPVGSKHFGDAYKNGELLLGTEESGHQVVGKFYDDGLSQALMVLKILAESGQSIATNIAQAKKDIGFEGWAYKRVNAPLTDEIRNKITAPLADNPQVLADQIAGIVGKKIAHFYMTSDTEDMETISNEDYEGKKVKSNEGIQVVFEDGSWVMIRLSGTEPVARLYTESFNEADRKAIEAAVRKAIFDNAMLTTQGQGVSYFDEPADLATTASDFTRGGIDFNTTVKSTIVSGETIKMNLDPAMMARFRKGDFTGIQINILKVTPLPSVLPLFGMAPIIAHKDVLAKLD